MNLRPGEEPFLLTKTGPRKGGLAKKKNGLTLSRNKKEGSAHYCADTRTKERVASKRREICTKRRVMSLGLGHDVSAKYHKRMERGLGKIKKCSLRGKTLRP